MHGRKHSTQPAGAFGRSKVLAKLFALSEHRDGYQREAAVRRLGMLAHPSAIPYLIVRANDWVPQVRHAAHVALERLLVPQHADIFARNLPNLLRLQTCGRQDHSALLARVLDFLAREPNSDSLLACAASLDARSARVAMHVAIQRRVAPLSQLLQLALAHVDPGVRSVAADALAELVEPDFSVIVAVALADPIMIVRRKALRQLLLRDLNTSLEAARTALLDRSPAIRALAVKALSNAAQDVDTAYDDAATASTRAHVLKCAAWGWAHLDSRHRLPQLMSWLTDTRARVRCAALKATARLLGNEGSALYLRSLRDPSPRVANEAARLLSTHRSAVNLNAVLDAAHSTAADHVIRACLRVMQAGNRWDRLLFILELLGCEQLDSSRSRLLEALETWDAQFSRGTPPPTAAQCERLPAALAACAASLPPRRFERLHFTFRTCGVDELGRA